MNKQNNETKQAILAAIRENLAKSKSFDANHQVHQAAKKSSGAAIETLPALVPLISPVELFRQNLEAVGGNYEIVNNEIEAAETVEKIIAATNAQKVAVSDAPLVKKLSGFLKNRAAMSANASAAELFDADIGITGAQFGIAETGTLILESEREFNRLASLIPPIHICLLEAKFICQTLGEVLEILQPNLSRTITFITGPSRTSDIELTLAIGVHGPAELYVIVIE